MFLLCSAALAATPPTLPVDREVFRHPLRWSPPSAPGDGMQPDWDVAHYEFGVELDPDRRRADMDVVITATARVDDPGELWLHASGFTLDELWVDGEAGAWRDAGDDRIAVTMPDGLSAGDAVTVEARYATSGNGGGLDYGLNWGDPIFSFHEPNGARNWLLSWDDPADKATLTWRITAPSDLVVVANGMLEEAVDDGERTTWVYDFPWPIPTYLAVLHAGTYEGVEDDTGPVPVWTWAPPSLIDQAAEDFANTGEMIATLSELWGDYPWSHYANVTAPFGGAMEHTTATTMGESLVGTAWAEFVNVHELGHHWWGDWVTLAEWEEIWLNEGFASYTEVLWTEAAYGEEEARSYREIQRASYFEWQAYEHGSSLYDPIFLFGGTVYDKGSLVLHMLRTVVGDEAFFAALRAYGEAHAFDVATTDDLQAAMEEASGLDLDWFFDEWVYRGGDPDYVVGLTTRRLDDGTWQADVHVAQDGDETWTMPVAVRIDLADGGSETVEALADGPHAVTSFCLDAEPVDLEFDPDGDQLYASLDRDDDRFEPAEDACSAGDDTGDAGEEPGGCGCAAGPASGGWLAAAAGLLGLLRRRQRRRRRR